MTSEKLKELLALEAKATPGPWHHTGGFIRDERDRDILAPIPDWDYGDDERRGDLVRTDAWLVSVARNNIREMAEEIIAWREGRYWLTYETMDPHKKRLDDIAAAVTGKTGDGWTYVPDTLACEIRAMREKLEAAEARVRELEAAGKVLVQFVVDMAGYGHDDDCPLDDTCDCSKKPRNDALNAACRVMEGRT